MASSHHVNSLCNQIHDLVQSSGLHFMINQTPWSSFITIRRKFINSKDVPVVKPKIETVFSRDEFTRIMEKNKQLEAKNVSLKEALVNLEEEHRAAGLLNEDACDNLLNTIDHLEKELLGLESEVRRKESENLKVKNVIATKKRDYTEY